MSDSRQIEQAAAAWLARRDAGALTARDGEALDAWLDADARHRVAFLRLDAAWREAGRLQALAAGGSPAGLPARGHWAGARDATANRGALGDAPRATRLPDLSAVTFADRAPVRSRLRGPARWATAAVVMAAAGAGMFGAWEITGREYAQHASALGEIRSVALADGSTATLSSDSEIRVAMSRGERRLELARGEAFFDVARDAARPFVVIAGGRRVAAVGTRFSVRRDAADLRVVVTEGKVRLEADADAAGIAPPVTLLPAGSVASVDRNGVLVRSLSVADAERQLEWRSGYLAFDDTALSVAALEFNRFNTRKLQMGDASVARLRVGGNFRWSNAEGFARLLEQGFPVQAEYHPDRIVLHSR